MGAVSIVVLSEKPGVGRQDLPKTSWRRHDVVTAQHNDYTGRETNIRVGNRQPKFPRLPAPILDVSTGRFQYCIR